MTMFQNGMFVKRGHVFNILDHHNVVTTKVLYDFFDTMTNWNAVAVNLIWCRRHINEYQFWYLLTLLQTHHREFNNIVLPAMYEVLPTQFFTGDVMNKGMKGLMLNFDHMKNNQVVIMQNFTNGMLGSMIDDDNDNVYDLNDIKYNSKINDWNTLKKVANDIHGQTRKFNMINMQNVNDDNKDIKTGVFNNIRNLNQGNKFNNNGEDRMNYFTQDIGLNNYYYFSRFGNSRLIDDKQMYNNFNDKAMFHYDHGLTVNSGELKDKINRRGGRYLYQMQQLLARYNLERLSNGLDNVKQINLDGKIDNGVFTNLKLTNGLQMHNRMNNYLVNNDHTRKLVDLVKDFENRYRQAIDQGFVETLNGRKITLNNRHGYNMLGNLLQGNTNNINTQYYRTLEYFYRLILGGNYIDNMDRADKRFTTTVMGHHETTLRDPVFWQIMKRITNIGDIYNDKLVGYTKKDTDFKGVKINDVTVDKMLTTFGYFDADITNGFNVDLVNMCKRKNGLSRNRSNRSNMHSGSGSVSRRGGRNHNSGSYGRTNSRSNYRSNSRSIDRNVVRMLKNWSNNRSNLRHHNFSNIRRVINRSNIRNNNSVRRIVNRMNFSRVRVGKGSVSRMRQMINNKSFRRVLKGKLMRNFSTSRSTGRGFTRNISWKNVFGLRNRSINKTFTRSVNRSVMRRFNGHGKFNNKFVRNNYRNRSSGNRSFGSGSNSRSFGRRSLNRSLRNISGGRSNGRSVNRSNTRFNWKNWFGFGNKKSFSRNRSFNNRNSIIKNLSKLRRVLNNVSGGRKNRSMIKLKITLNKLKNMSNVRGLRNVRGISKIRNNVSKFRNISKNRNNSLIRNLSKMRKDLSVIRKINKNVSNRKMNKTVIRKMLNNVRNMNVRSVDRILRKFNKNRSFNGSGSGSRMRLFNRSSGSNSDSNSNSGSFSRNRSNNRTGRRNFNRSNGSNFGSGMRRFGNSNNRSIGRFSGNRSNSKMRNYLNKFGNRGTNNKVNYFKNIMGLNS